MKRPLNLPQDWPQLARDVNYSVSELSKRLARKYKAVYRVTQQKVGMSPKQLLLFRCMCDAGEALASGTQVKQIFDQFGFSDSAHFSRAFTRIWKMSPREFQRISANVRLSETGNS